MNRTRYQVVIVGAGPAGMAAATQLAERGHRVSLFDSAAEIGGQAIFPSDKPYMPFQQWAMQAEGLKKSPLGMLIHPVYGLWHAYRGAILMPASALREVIKERFAQQIATGQAITGSVAAAMIEEIQGRFQVSQDAARVRLLRLQGIRDVVSTPALF